MAETGRRKDSDSIMAGLIVDFEEAGVGVDRPDSIAPFAWIPGTGKVPFIGLELGIVLCCDDAGSQTLLPTVHSSAS